MVKTKIDKMQNVHPILFSTPMVAAILAGRKTMTRRLTNLEVVNKFPNDVQFLGFQDYPDGSFRAIFQSDDSDEAGSIKFPYGKPGDTLWVRESFYKSFAPDGITFPAYYFKVSHGGERVYDKDIFKWKPSIFMPKEAARLFLKITDVKVERLQEISEADAIAEGVEDLTEGQLLSFKDYLHGAHPYTAKGSFKSLWLKINGLQSWDANPWCWVISFERTGKPEKY